MKNIREIGKDIIQELEQTVSSVVDKQAQDLIQAILQAGKIFVAGAGRSGFMVRAFHVLISSPKDSISQ